MIVRDAVETDLPGLVAITNDVIRTSTAIFSDREVDLADRRAWAEGRRAAGHPVLAAVDNGGVIGFASYGPFRSGPPGYRFSVEHSVHVRADRRRSGVASALMRALIARARTAGLHVMVGGIDAGSAASIAFHARLGFVETGRMPGVGFKAGRRLDLVLMQLELQGREEA